VKDPTDSTRWQETSNQFVPIVLVDSDKPERYYFQVRAMDRDGNIDRTHDQTEFFKIKVRDGGNIQFTDSTASIRLLVPPGVLAANQKIMITPVPKYQLANPANVVIAYRLSATPEDFVLPKPATLSISFSNWQSFRSESLAIYYHDPVSLHIGGTISMQSGRAVITTVITQLGVYSVKNRGDTSAVDSKFNLNIQPRIFSPSGNGRGHGDRTTVSFFLSQPSSVIIKIYNSAGRLEKVLTEKNSWLLPGSNAIDWDGSDEVGKICSSGLYIVTVAAENRVHHKTVMILNKF
jgi:hypothetical protein